MLNYFNANKKNSLKKLELILNRRKFKQKSRSTIVKKILNEVIKNGDKALIRYEKQFSQVKIKSNSIKFSSKEIVNIANKIDKKLKKSIDVAYERISYPSTVLMNCIPALVAGVKDIYLTTPSLGKSVNPAVIYAAKKCGVKEIYKIGGAHSIAAFAYGTKTFKKVDKIVGPGNAFVASAKKEVFGDVGIDMVAGPSEVSIIADKFSNPEWIASDLIAQAEHDIFAQSILITNSKELIKLVNLSLKVQLDILPKKKIASQSIKNFGLAIYATSQSKIIEVINTIAPEHLEIDFKDYNKIVKKIKNAGSLFLGKFSPEAMGDYIAGPNHVLPTSGSAKFSSGLSVNDFLKRYSLIKITKSGIERLGPLVINLAEHENLEGHAKSIRVRIEKDK